MIGREGEEQNMDDQANDALLFSDEAELEESFAMEVEELAIQADLPHDDSDHHAETPRKKEGHKETNPQLEKFLAEFAQQADVEAKLKFAIDFMEASLAQNGSPSFRNFWEVRKSCLELFKDESLQPQVRFQLWNKYVELSKEARRLKEILDEQSAFAAEQIEIAIQALEQEIHHLPELLVKAPPLDFPTPLPFLEGAKLEFYDNKQKELNLLNAYASRINALRKELIKTDMRIRQKNKFFQRLSTAGDHVFPRRKELIKEVSQRFIDDVESFIQHNFVGEDVRQPLFSLREEIKALQGVAKLLTLNTQSFTQTRTKLSECWDMIKKLDKERKKERAVQKAAFKQHVEQVLQKLQELQQQFSEGGLTHDQAMQKLEEVNAFMRSQRLGHDEVKMLREEVAKVRAPIFDRLKAQEQERHHHEQERDRQKRERFQTLKQKVSDLLKKADGMDADLIVTSRDALVEEIQSSALTKVEKQELEKLVKPLRDVIDDKKRKKLMDLSSGDQQVLQQLQSLLVEAKQRRQESKSQLEVLRKTSGSSGLDFNQGLLVNEQISSEKERLEKINQTIRELEDKIDDLESQ